MAITFMAKFDEREGNSCHIHLSVREEDGTPLFAEQPEVFDGFLAGQLACLRELTLFLAPNVNSYKRYAEGSFAPTAVAWGRDNRTCSYRVIGHGQSLRVENRVAGGDVNPYLAIAAMIAAGLHGVDEGLEPEPALRGQRLHVRQAARARARCARRATCSRPPRSPARPSGRTSSRTTSTTPTSSCARSRPRSPTGSASGGSSACEAGDRPVHGARAGAVERVGLRRPSCSTATTSTRSSAPAASPSCCRPTRALVAAARRGARPASTAWCWPAAPTSTPPTTAPTRTTRRPAPCRSATPSSSRSSAGRSSATSPSSASAAACRS